MYKLILNKLLPFLILILILFTASQDVSSFTKIPEPNNIVKKAKKINKNTDKKLPEPYILSIPKIGVEAYIEPVGVDLNGKMDAPSSFDIVGWYKFGPKPGEIGNSVIAGHYDTFEGNSAIFYHLSDLSVNDLLIVTDKEGNQLTFKIFETYTYYYKDSPLNKIFGTSEKPQLNLITCSGSFDPETKNYSHRTVIYSELVGANNQ